MRSELINIAIEDYIQWINPKDRFNDELFVTELNSFENKIEDYKDIPVKLDALSILLACKGELNINIDFFPYKLKNNMVLEILSHHIINSMSFSDDFVGYNIVVTKDFLNNTFNGENNIPIEAIAARSFSPIQTLQDKDFKLLLDIVKRLKNNIQRKAHSFQATIIKNELSNFLYELLNINSTSSIKQTGRQEQVAMQFIKLLIKHSVNEHEVSFYANELCITPEYLSRTVKALSGKTAGKWIAEAIIAEAKILLRRPNVTIQLISEKLNFSDQSSFGKFFKKHTTKSPKEYRNNLRNML